MKTLYNLEHGLPGLADDANTSSLGVHDSVEFGLGPKVQYESNLQERRADITKHLEPRCRRQHGPRFVLNDDLSVNYHVNSLISQYFAFVHDWNADFPFYRMASSEKLSLHCQ